MKLFVAILIFILTSCAKKESNQTESRKSIEMQTNYGTIVLELYNETPKHRDNFIKIVKDGVLDSVLFHRVINRFMIQGGDPDSKHASSTDTLGNGGLDYKVDAEFLPTLFHKKGAIGAARDGNPERASASTQFYIVQGKVFTDSLLELAEKRINGWLADHYAQKDSSNKDLVSALKKAREENNRDLANQLRDSLRTLAKYDTYTIPNEHRDVYKTVGGTPHLDQNYTVFGEVVSGLNIVDSIATVKTGLFDRPIEDVRILSIKVLE